MQTANKAMEGILDGNDLNITGLNHLIYAVAMVITEEVNGTGEYKLETQRSKHSCGLDTHWRAQIISERNCQLWWKYKEVTDTEHKKNQII